MELTLRQQLDTAKEKLHEAQTAYLHAFASNRLEDIAKHKRQVNKLTREIGQLVKIKLASGIN
tara:strand:- start:461 stop:649 length:189 start_codon:yes stop_codon:yes gene_type:complete